MITYVCQYNILPEHTTRETCMTFFGGMTQEDDARELGEVMLLGRWACVGEAKGYCIAQAPNNFHMQQWLNNWVSMADIKVTPCLDDNEHRELILGKDPPYKVVYDKVGNMAKKNESLYFIKYKFKEGCKDQGFDLFANMTEEMDEGDSGKCTSYGRWHVPSEGCGYAVTSSPSAMDVYKWAYNWNSLCDCTIVPVTDDENTRKIIQCGFGYDVKHEKLMNQLKEYYPQVDTNCCFPGRK